MGKIIISTIHERVYLFLFDDNHEIALIKNIETSIVDNIYIGKIVEINEGLNAAFVSVSNDQKVFLSLSEFPKDQKPKCGDELPVQIKTDALKTKLPQAKIEICIPGEFAVGHLNQFGIKVSKKLEPELQKELQTKVENANIDEMENYGFVLRTNCETLNENNMNLLFDEMKDIISILKKIKENSQYLSLYTTLYKAKSKLFSVLSDIDLRDFDTIVTDNKEIYEELSTSFLNDCKDIKYYDDEYVSLKNLHSLETYLCRAFDKQVYLDCGGYLIIEPTEALTSIDVNSGKTESRRKESQNFIFKVNRQAAIEVAKQIKIRNISGIIIIDFINMTDEKMNNELLDILSKEFEKDRVTTKCIDMTPLGLVEVTRKKSESPLF